MAKKRAEKKPLEILNNQLAYAAANGDMNGVRDILFHGAEEHTAVAIAAESGHAEIVRFMMDRMDMEDRDDMEALETALSAAARVGHAEIAILLMAAGVSPCHAVAPALEKGHGDIAAAAIKAGGELSINEENIRLCLAHSMTDILDYMQRIGEVNFTDLYYRSERSGSARRFDRPSTGKLPTKSVTYLLDHGFEAKRVLSEAVSHKRNDLFDLLIARSETDANSLLEFSAREDSMFGLKEALARGADLNAAGGKAILEAISKGNPQAATFLLDSGCNATPVADQLLLAACQRSNMDSIIFRLVESGANVNDSEGTILCYALRLDDRTLFDRLLEKGADAGRKNSISIRWAIERGRPERIPDLLAHGAKMEEGGKLAMETAIYHRNNEAITILLAHGANLMDGISYALRNRELDRLLPCIQNSPPDAFDPTEALREAVAYREMQTAYDKKTYVSFLSLLMERGADVAALSPEKVPPELGVDLVASGARSPGLVWGTLDPILAFRRIRYLVSGERPAIKTPGAMHMAPRDNWREDIVRARESGKDMALAAEKGGFSAWLLMLAANTEKLAEMADRHDLLLPERRAEMRTKAAAWRKTAGRSPSLCAATETASAYAEPELLHAAMLALPSESARSQAAALLAEHAITFNMITSRHGTRLAEESARLDVAIRSAGVLDDGKLITLRQKLANTFSTQITPETLAKLEKIAERGGADTAIATLMGQPQSFDIHFMNGIAGRFRPWVWLRRRFHADSWHSSLDDYRKHLKTWQAADPDGSFAALREILDIRHAAARHTLPLAILKETSGESAAFFNGVAAAADSMASIALALSRENNSACLGLGASSLFQPLPETQQPETPRPPMPTMERQ